MNKVHDIWESMSNIRCSEERWNRIFGKKDNSPGKKKYIVKKGELKEGISRQVDNKNIRSDAMGINPKQYDEAMKIAPAGVDYDKKTGEAIYTNYAAKKRHMKQLGFYERR